MPSVLNDRERIVAAEALKVVIAEYERLSRAASLTSIAAGYMGKAREASRLHSRLEHEVLAG